MPRASLVVPVLALLLGACAATAPADPMAGMPQPRAEHAFVLQGVGTWKGELTSYMPGAPPEPQPATEVVEAIGGFWTQSRFRCDFMGMPYLGTGCIGFDPARRCYVGTWIDNMSDQLAHMSGELSPDGKTLVMRWTMRDPDSGLPVASRSETTFGPDSYTATFYMGHGAGQKSMVIRMQRVAGG